MVYTKESLECIAERAKKILMEEKLIEKDDKSGCRGNTSVIINMFGRKLG